jgi:DNA adenine methylase
MADWRRIEIDSYADGARPRVEVLWINPAAIDAFAAAERARRLPFLVSA